MFKLFSLVGEIAADTGPMDRSLGRARDSLGRFVRQVDRASERVGGSFGGIGRVINGVANGIRSATTGTRGLYNALSIASGVAGGLAIGKRAILGASALNETVSKVGVVFEDAASIVTRGADKMASAFGVPKGEFLDAAASIGLIAKASGLATGPAAQLSERLARLAVDASSFYNVDLPEALTALRAGLVGESEPMRRFGVLLSEAAVQNEALALGLVRSKKEIDEGAKVQARASLITKGLADATGDLERTQGSFANKLRAISGRVENALVGIGQHVLPVFEAAANVLGDALGRMNEFLAANGAYIRAWSDGVARGVSRVVLIWEHLGDFRDLGLLAVQEKFLQGFEVLKRVLGTVWDAIRYGAETAQRYLQNFFEGMATYLEKLFATLGQNLGESIRNGILDAIKPIASVVQHLPGMLPIAALSTLPRPAPTPIVGDRSGLTAAARMRGIGPAPDLADRFRSRLPDLSHLIDPILSRLDGALAVRGMTAAAGKVPGAVGAMVRRAMNPVEMLNAANARGVIRIPGLSSGSAAANEHDARIQGKPYFGPDAVGGLVADQKRSAAMRVLRARADRDAADLAREQRQFRGANFGAAGKLAGVVAGGIQAGVKKLGGSDRIGRAAGMAGALLGFGAAGLAGAQQAATGGRAGRRRRGGLFPTPGEMFEAPDPNFRSQFHGLADFSRTVSSDALNGVEGKKMDKQLDFLGGIAEGIGTRNSTGGSNSVIGLLNKLVQKGGGPGFAT